jgi:hypothetical protein
MRLKFSVFPSGPLIAGGVTAGRGFTRNLNVSANRSEEIHGGIGGQISHCDFRDMKSLP